MDNDLVGRIREKRELPLIGVIGATTPTEDYRTQMGMEVGYRLREYIDTNGGTIFTGGVEGAGLDAYTGVMKYCVDHKKSRGILRKQYMPDDRFFILVPKFVEDGNETDFSVRPYFPPSSYMRLAFLSPRGQLDSVTAGETMVDRREYVAAIADILVVVNGGYGTLNEAFCALEGSTHVVALPHTGGAARILNDIKNDNLNPEVRRKLELQQFYVTQINTDLLNVAESIEAMTEHLYRTFR